MIRPWGVQSLTGVAQPWFGDVLTAAFAPVGDGGPQKVTVASTTFYQVGDRIILGIGQANPTVLMVDRKFSATVLYCHSEGGAPIKAWASTTIIALAINVALISFQGVDGNTSAIWLGQDNTVTVAGGSAFRQIQKVAAASIPDWYDYRTATGGQNSINTDIGWMIGTAADKIVISGHQN